MTPAPSPGRAGRGPLPGALGALAAGLYGAAVARRNRRFDAGRGVRRIGLPVISIGNLSVGGTGKTPMVEHVCRVLLDAGVRPCIAMRGYAPGRRAGAGTDADEADEYRRHFGDAVDVVARPDRRAGIEALLAGGARPGAVVLDDGFQHRRIARDLDVVLVDASRDPFADRLLPAGWLREPVEALRRASCVVITHAELAAAAQLGELGRRIEAAHGGPPIAVTRHLWTALRDPDDRPQGLDWLLGRTVLGVCAIGNPRGFTEALRATVSPDAEPEVIELPDHDPYRPGTVARVVAAARAHGAEAIVTTDKDWSKLRRAPRATWPCPVMRPVLSLGFVRGGEGFDGLVRGAVAESSEFKVQSSK